VPPKLPLEDRRKLVSYIRSIDDLETVQRDIRDKFRPVRNEIHRMIELYDSPDWTEGIKLDKKEDLKWLFDCARYVNCALMIEEFERLKAAVQGGG